MTREERVILITEKAKKFLKPEISQWFSFKINEFLSLGVKSGVPPHDIVLILECLALAIAEANEDALTKEGGLDFVAGKSL